MAHLEEKMSHADPHWLAPYLLLGSLPSQFCHAYPQASIKMDIYMELPQGIQTAHKNSKDHMLKLEKNIYGQKQAGCVWNSFLVDKLMSIRFTPSLIDDCVFFRDDIIFMVYVDNGIFLGNDTSKFQDDIKEIYDIGLNSLGAISDWRQKKFDDRTFQVGTYPIST